ncbi:MAG: type VI secretion system protein TssA [Thermohalobaculum sp.]|nr:type VI secretion system protein TssA [Thermohalobaculum sp.]
MIDVEALLREFDADAPSGHDLEYDSDFAEMQLAAQPGEERQIGDAVIAAEEPDHADVIEKTLAVLNRSKDLRAAVILANSALRTEGLTAFEEVLRYVRGCLETYWDTCFPQLDADDDNDPTMRVNAALGLADPDGVLRAFRLAPLAMSRGLGRVCLRDILVAEGEIPAPSDMDKVPDAQFVSAVFQDTDPDRMAALVEASNRILEHVKAIGAIFDDRVGALGPDLTALEKMAFEVRKRMRTYAAGDAAAGDEDDAGDDGAAASDGGGRAAGGGRPGGSGAINSPNDVIAMIDRINDYYARNEPSSPVPLLLNRARRLVSADFMTIMKDLASGGVDQVRTIGGIQDDGY